MKIWITNVCLLFSAFISFGQTAINENWDLKAVYYFKNGSSRVADSVYTYSGNDSIDAIRLNNYKIKVEKEYDEFLMQGVIKCNGSIEKMNQDYKLVGLQYFIKPKRKIRTKDTFTVQLFESQRDGFDTLRKSISYNNLTEKSKRDDLFIDYIPLERINLSREVTTISLKYRSSDSTLGYLGHTFTTNTRNRIIGVFLENQKDLLNQFLYLNIKSMANNLLSYEPYPKQNWHLNYTLDELDTVGMLRHLYKINGQFKIEKTYAVIPKKLIISTKEKAIHFLMSSLPDSCKFKYKLVPWDIYDDKNIPWVECPINYDVVSVPIQKAGEYVLYIKSTNKFWNSVSYRITIRPQWFQTLAFKIALPLITILIGLVLFIISNKKRNKKKLEVLKKEKNTLDINLKSIRSQLNPHFIFNALNSIQSLITTTQYEKANEYLIEFSNLLRKPLNNEELKHWTLRDEIELLNSYIKIEQLRSPFKLDFTLDDRMNTEAINFPTLLIQPIVENAIKHALSQVEMPILSIKVVQEINNIVILIQDNGKGFDSEKSNQGNGLKLTKEYINLINQKYKHSNVSLKLVSNEGGTTVYLKLENWIDE
jgi:two-component sensor histidine kinase